MDTQKLLLFGGVIVLLVCTPGPDWLYVISRGLVQGRRTGLLAVAGICAGYAVHTAVAAAGLAATLRAVPAMLGILRYAGAAYLGGLAVRTLVSARRAGPAMPAPAPRVNVLRESTLTALLNPKGLVLYLALMPQFVDPAATAPVAVQVATLGAVHVVSCAIVYGAIALVVGLASRTLSTTPTVARRMSTVSAMLLLVVAAVTAGTH
jgi:threonine/homoserine/homoserine lactone efflux protein